LIPEEDLLSQVGAARALRDIETMSLSSYPELVLPRV
jgi:hypothetical protein